MLARLEAERQIQNAGAIAVGFGSDKGGRVMKAWKRQARGNRRRKFTPPSAAAAARVVAPHLAVERVSLAEFERTRAESLAALERGEIKPAPPATFMTGRSSSR